MNQTGYRQRYPASVLAPESALGSVPTGALSSAQADKNSNGKLRSGGKPEGPEIAHPALILCFGVLAKTEAGVGKQDAREECSESSAEIQVFRLRRHPVGGYRRQSSIGRGGLGAKEQSADLLRL